LYDLHSSSLATADLISCWHYFETLHLKRFNSVLFVLHTLLQFDNVFMIGNIKFQQ